MTKLLKFIFGKEWFHRITFASVFAILDKEFMFKVTMIPIFSFIILTTVFNKNPAIALLYSLLIAFIAPILLIAYYMRPQ